MSDKTYTSRRSSLLFRTVSIPIVIRSIKLQAFPSTEIRSSCRSADNRS